MSDLVRPSGTVHWVGAGLSTGSGLRAVCESAAEVVVWNRTVSRAVELLDRLGLSDRGSVRPFALDSMASAVRPGDVVVSMVPATSHPSLLGLCRDQQAHFACTSYASPEMAGLVGDGLVVLTEAGLDPGIDHLFARKLVAAGRAAVGDAATASFTSYCGGLPAEPNDFRYRFSWAPRGVLRALLSPARYIAGGEVRTAPRPWTQTSGWTVGGTPYEVYPNRDSLPFTAQYGFPSGWELQDFVRGTIRLDGWRAAWEPVFAVLLDGDEAHIDALADDLARRYPATDLDYDRVVLEVMLSLRTPSGDSWSGGYLLDLLGDDTGSAMARTVSLALAFGVLEMLAGRLPAGLHRAAEDLETVDRWLAFLTTQGLRYTEIGQ